MTIEKTDNDYEKEQAVLNIVLKHNMPESHWVIKEIQKLPDAIEHINFITKAYHLKYKNNKNKKRIVDIKINNLKLKMIEEWITDFISKHHMKQIDINRGINNYAINILDKQNQETDKSIKYLFNQTQNLNNLIEYFKFTDFEADYKNKIGIFKYSLQGRSYYMETNKIPYAIY